MESNKIINYKRISPQLLVSDLDVAIEFYSGVLQFSIDFIYEDYYAGLINDGLSIHLKKSYDPSRPNPQKSIEDPDILFFVSAIQNLFVQFKEQKVCIIQPLRQMPYGKEFYISDPDHHVLAFLEVPTN